jgi:phage virion morphogenesis protein
MASITVTVQSQAVRRLLQRIVLQQAHLKPAFETIGAALVSTTQQRFLDERDPDGTPWKPLAASTILARLPKRTLSPKRGRVTKATLTAAGALTILRNRGHLFNSITYVADDQQVMAGSNRVQAALMQLGGTPAMPPGAAAVPERPYLGVNTADEKVIGDVLVAHFAAVAP